MRSSLPGRSRPMLCFISARVAVEEWVMKTAQVSDSP